ncbi:hypothetical protein [Longispora albida]|uniref:hypothetical protein n=1 Tax=Longispora albida TaxID=203523 RepID=UPI000382878D|nr:hypothetical protein [Longispora albida]
MTHPVRPQPNPVFWLLGLLGILAGLAVMALAGLGFYRAFTDPGGPLDGDGPALFTGSFAMFAWGAIVFTLGRYVWRGARRRGSRDRFGRLLIVVGYVLAGFAIQAATRGMYELMTDTSSGTGAAEAIVIRALLMTAAFGIPGGIIGSIGIRLADEKILLTAEVKGGF